MNRLNNNDMKIFSKLYEETVTNSTRISKEAFLTCIGKEPGQTDLSGLYPMKNIDFLYAVYENFFYRMPDKDVEKKWEADAGRLETDEFRKKLVYQILKSEEYEMKNFGCSHNIYIPFLTGVKAVGKIYYKEEIEIRLKALARKLPFGMYGKIKSLLGR